MLILSESINQSIISDSGNSYEERLLSLLVWMWIPKNSIKVTIDGTKYEISPVTFNKLKCEYDKEEKKLKYIVEYLEIY